MTPTLLHALFEAAAYAIGFRLFLRERRRRALPALADREASLAIGVGAILGAALGAKIAYWLYDPAYAFAGLRDGHLPDWRTCWAASRSSARCWAGSPGWRSRRSSTACAVRPGMPSSGH